MKMKLPRQQRLDNLWLIGLVATGVAVLVVLPTVYAFWFFINGQSLSTATSDWGTFGDFVGGVANPVIALLALLGLIHTIKQQQDEFKKTTRALDEQAENLREQVALARFTSKRESCTTTLVHVLDRIESVMNIPFPAAMNLTTPDSAIPVNCLMHVKFHIRQYRDINKRFRVADMNHATITRLLKNVMLPIAGVYKDIQSDDELSNDPTIQFYMTLIAEYDGFYWYLCKSWDPYYERFSDLQYPSLR